MDPNYKWLTTADLTQFEGEWVIIVGQQVVAHGQDLDELYEMVDRDYPGESRLTVNVPKEGVYVL
jgi:hypothetical protein